MKYKNHDKKNTEVGIKVICKNGKIYNVLIYSIRNVKKIINDLKKIFI